MIAHGVAGTQMKDAAVLAGLQAVPTRSPAEGFAQIFQQKTQSTLIVSLSTNLAGDALTAGTPSSIKPASPINEEHELETCPSAAMPVLKAIRQAPPIAGKSSEANSVEQIAEKEVPCVLAEVTSSVDMLPPKVELASGHPLSEAKPSVLSIESPAQKRVEIVRLPLESVVPAVTSTDVLPSQVQTASVKKPVHLTGSGWKGSSEKAVDATHKEQALNRTLKIENASVNDAPVELALSSGSLAMPAQASAQEVNPIPIQQLQSSPGWKSESGDVQTTSITSGGVISTEKPQLNQQTKNVTVVVQSSALEGEVKSAERLNSSINSIVSRHTIDSQKAVSAPLPEPLSLTASGHPADLAALAGASTIDRSSIDAAPLQATPSAVMHGSVSLPHGTLSLEASSEPLVAMPMPAIAHTTLSATPTSLEVGVASGSHGWLKIRAELAENGAVSASLTGGSPGAAEKLRGDLPALSSYLQEEKVQVSSISIHSAVIAASASALEAQPPPALFERSGNDSSSGLLAAFGEGRQDGQPQQPSGDANSEKQSVVQESGEVAGLISSSAKNAGLYGAEQRQGLDGSEALPSVEYGTGGGWLNVRA